MAEHGLTTGPRALVYPDEKLPSFFIPSLHSNIFQGSCRKPHAEHDSKPQYDQMRSADTLLQETCNQIKQRPSLLILSGDQIYADDVSPALLAALIEKAEALTGWKEQLPTAEGPVLVPADLELCGRDSLLNADITGFSSGEKRTICSLLVNLSRCTWRCGVVSRYTYLNSTKSMPGSSAPGFGRPVNAVNEALGLTSE